MQVKIDERDWSTLSRGEQIKQLEVEGYLVIPNLLNDEQIAALEKQTANFEIIGTDTPFYCTTMQRIRIDEAEISDDAKRLILRNNALRILPIGEY